MTSDITAAEPRRRIDAALAEDSTLFAQLPDETWEDVVNGGGPSC